MACDFVVKKYLPIIAEAEHPSLYKELLERFCHEARLLFRLNHPNIVRVFNYFDYQEMGTSYILMEYVLGQNILSYLKENPEAADRVFEDVIDGFSHLENQGVLHRDIRPDNILVSAAGEAKIIDFGFGKVVNSDESEPNFKSISLNWWCATPPEFNDRLYDFQTEVYFVGKIFEKAISEHQLDSFKYKTLTERMCDFDRSRRFASFADVKRLVTEGRFQEISFSREEVKAYREFSKELMEIFISIKLDAKYERDAGKVLAKLQKLYRSNMLEEQLAKPSSLGLIFLNGGFTYNTRAEVYTETILNFSNLLHRLSDTKKNIVIENLIGRLDAVDRENPGPLDDESPF